jgi:hypothetical protein
LIDIDAIDIFAIDAFRCHADAIAFHFRRLLFLTLITPGHYADAADFAIDAAAAIDAFAAFADIFFHIITPPVAHCFRHYCCHADAR